MINLKQTRNSTILNIFFWKLSLFYKCDNFECIVLYFVSFVIMCNFFFNNLIVLLISRWSNMNWLRIFCINCKQFLSNISVNSIAINNLSNRSNDKNVWNCCFCRSFFLFEMFSAHLVNAFAFSLNFSEK
jgi:hypothetical protein